MKKVILVGIMFMMFMGVVSASSINGAYKGNPIVKIFSSSTEVKPDDVPALIYNGRTVVPISMLKKLGVGVTWNPNDYSVDVKIPDFQDDLKKLKAYEDLTDYFNILHVMGEKFNSTRLELTLIVSYLKLNINMDTNLISATKQLNDLIDYYNGAQKLAAYAIDVLLENQIYDLSIGDILKNYFNSIDNFKSAVDKLNSYATNNDYAAQYFNDMQKAVTNYDNAQKNSIDSYDKYHNLIVNYKTSLTPSTPTPSPVTKPTTTVPDTVYIPNDVMPNVIETKMDGDFEGWEGETIFKLANGQIWQQVSYAYTYHYAFRPDVLIYKDGSAYKMKVEGVDKTITVKRLK